MKRAILIGAIAFALGAVSSPKAANDGETLRVLCERFKAVSGDGILASFKQSRDESILKLREVRRFDRLPDQLNIAREEGRISSFELIRGMVCVK